MEKYVYLIYRTDNATFDSYYDRAIFEYLDDAKEYVEDIIDGEDVSCEVHTFKHIGTTKPIEIRKVDWV